MYLVPTFRSGVPVFPSVVGPFPELPACLLFLGQWGGEEHRKTGARLPLLCIVTLPITDVILVVPFKCSVPHCPHL